MSAVLTQRAMRPALRRAWGPRAPGCGRAAFQTDAGAGQHAGAPRTPLRFLVIDGYSAEGRAELSAGATRGRLELLQGRCSPLTRARGTCRLPLWCAGGASTAGVLYRKMLDRCSPVGATSDIAHPADDGFEAPDMSWYVCSSACTRAGTSVVCRAGVRSFAGAPPCARCCSRAAALGAAAAMLQSCCFVC